eukprot:Platyproteum_vivax@DN4827_c0_g1_i2.p1
MPTPKGQVIEPTKPKGLGQPIDQINQPKDPSIVPSKDSTTPSSDGRLNRPVDVSSQDTPPRFTYQERSAMYISQSFVRPPLPTQIPYTGWKTLLVTFLSCFFIGPLAVLVPLCCPLDNMQNKATNEGDNKEGGNKDPKSGG